MKANQAKALISIFPFSFFLLDSNRYFSVSLIGYPGKVNPIINDFFPIYYFFKNSIQNFSFSASSSPPGKHFTF